MSELYHTGRKELEAEAEDHAAAADLTDEQIAARHGNNVADLISTSHAARYLGCSPYHVGLLARRGVLAGAKKDPFSGTHWMVPLQAVLAYRRGRRRPGQYDREAFKKKPDTQEDA